MSFDISLARVQKSTIRMIFAYLISVANFIFLGFMISSPGIKYTSIILFGSSQHTPGYVPFVLTTHISCPGVQLRLVLCLKNDVTSSI